MQSHIKVLLAEYAVEAVGCVNKDLFLVPLETLKFVKLGFDVWILGMV
jgi:hypothetical protein